MMVQSLADINHTLTNPFGIIFLIESVNHSSYFLVPVFITYFLVNAFIPEYSELMIFQCNVNDYRIALISFLHSQFEKQFRCSVKRIHILAAILHEYANLATCALFSLTDCFYNSLPLFFTEETGT